MLAAQPNAACESSQGAAPDKGDDDEETLDLLIRIGGSFAQNPGSSSRPSEARAGTQFFCFANWTPALALRARPGRQGGRLGDALLRGERARCLSCATSAKAPIRGGRWYCGGLHTGIATDSVWLRLRLWERVAVSDCLVGQAFCHGRLSLTMALRMVKGLRATAVGRVLARWPIALAKARIGPS